MMNDADKQELETELEHKQALVRALKARRRPLELQAVRKGINVDPEVAVDLEELTHQIQAFEGEVNELRIQLAEGDIPLAEVEYRAALAAAWEPGRPTVAGAANLEWVRVRSGIKPERAEEMEREVRATLAEEAIKSLRSTLFNILSYHNLQHEDYDGEIARHRYIIPSIFDAPSEFRTDLGRAIRLDISVAIPSFLARIDSDRFRVIFSNRIVVNPQLAELLGTDDDTDDTIDDMRYENITVFFEHEPALLANPIKAFARWLRDTLMLDNNIEVEDPDYSLIVTFVKAVAGRLATNSELSSEEDEATTTSTPE